MRGIFINCPGKLTLLILMLFICLVGFISCGGSSGGGSDGGNDGGNNTPQTYTASGNYVYNPDTGMLVLTFVLSDFIGCGPTVGDENKNVDSITATTMHWVEDNMTWTRDSGTADDILGTWDWVDEDGNAYEITFNNDFSMDIVAEIVDCDDIDASGTWEFAYTIDLAGLDANFHCVPGDSEGDNTRDAIIVINETGDDTFVLTVDGNTINGTISGGVYTFSGSWFQADIDTTFSISGSFTLNSLTSLAGSDVFRGTNPSGDFCTWEETFIGTRQGS